MRGYRKKRGGGGGGGGGKKKKKRANNTTNDRVHDYPDPFHNKQNVTIKLSLAMFPKVIKSTKTRTIICSQWFG